MPFGDVADPFGRLGLLRVVKLVKSFSPSVECSLSIFVMISSSIGSDLGAVRSNSLTASCAFLDILSILGVYMGLKAVFRGSTD